MSFLALINYEKYIRAPLRVCKCVLLATGEQEREIQNAQVLPMPSKSGDKRTYVWAKTERTCVLLANGVLSMSSKSGDKRTYVWEKAKRTCVLLDIEEHERVYQNAQVNFIKVRRQKKVISRSYFVCL